MTDPLAISAFLCLLVALAEGLARVPVLKHLGSALLVIVLGAVAANAGAIPVYSVEIGVYSAIFDVVGPVAIFCLLLQVDLRAVAKAGGPMLLLFGLGAVGTALGVLLGMQVVDGAATFGDLHYALGGMFVGTYTGGSANFNAIAMEYGFQEAEPVLYAGATAVDSAMTTVWMIVCVGLPRLFAPHTVGLSEEGEGDSALRREEDTVGLVDVAMLGTLSLSAWFLAQEGSAWLEASFGANVPSMLLLTVLALVLAQLPPIRALRGKGLVGLFGVQLFLAVIGALCDVSALDELGQLGWSLTAFVAIVVGVHGVVQFAPAVLRGGDLAMASIASQANIGGGTTALALAKSLGRADLALPAILLGSCGTALGNFLGFAVASWLR